MKLSTKSRYGTRALLDITLHCDKGPVHLKDLAKRQELSLKYLEQIILILKASGFIRSIRGASGGYTLAKNPSDIKILDIIQALEGPLSIVECIDIPELCSRTEECATREIWKDVQIAINDILGSMTLTELAERQKQKTIS